MANITCVNDLKAGMQDLDIQRRAYYSDGSGDQITVFDNEKAFKRLVSMMLF